MSALRIALVNDYEVVVRGLAAMLRSYQDVVGIVELDANRTVAEPVDIALYDTFAGTQGDGADVRSLAANPQVRRVVVYSWVMDAGLIHASLANGAAAYVSKQLPAAQLVDTLTAVHHGRAVPSPPRFAARVPVIGGDWPGREEGLTQRESEVLALITQGLSNDEIAARAHLSINSVKTYIRNCYRRIGVSTRSNAVLWGVDHGFRPDRVRVDDPDTHLANPVDHG